MTGTSIFRKASLLALGLILAGALGALAQSSNVGRFLYIFINGNRLTASSGTAVVTMPNSTDTLVGRATTDTLTGKTIDAEGTGNLVTIPFTEWWPANTVDGSAYLIGWNMHTSATDAPTDVINGGTGVNLYGTLRFDDSATETINRQWLIPSDWTGAIDVQIVWQTVATSGNVKWQVALACIADNENMDPATFSFNTANTVTDTAKGTPSFLNTASITGLTTTGCAAGELLVLKLFRNPADAADTLANDADLVGVLFKYRRAI